MRTNETCKTPEISTELVFEHLINLDVNKSIGVNGVSPRVLVNCANSLAVPLCHIFDLSLSSGTCPAKWKQANVTPIYKKGSRLETNNYRPVSLTSIVCKVLEKIIRDAIMNHLTSNNLLSEKQHGFVNGKACVTNLLETIEFLTKRFCANIPIDIIFMDFLKAFDLVAHKRLAFKLSCYGITGSLLAWIVSFLSNRVQRVVMGEVVSSWEEVTSGVPQGSVLGPILFILYINEISEILISLSELYADDTKLLKEIQSEEDIHILQNDINRIVDWTRTWLMKLNESKCKVMHIGRTNEKHLYSIESFDGQTKSMLTETTLERDLGIMISSDLKWNHHVKHCANKANKILGMLTRTFEYRDLKLFKSLYTTFVRPHLEFAVAVWSPYLKVDISILEKVQRRATKLIPELRNLPYEDRLSVIGLTTLEVRRERGDLIQLFKIINQIDIVHWPSNPNPVVTNNPVVKTRGHDLKLKRELVKNCEQRHQFFSNRVVNNWNSLPEDIVHSENVNIFKARLDKFLN